MAICQPVVHFYRLYYTLIMSDISKKDLIRTTLYWDARLNPNQKYLGRCAVVLKRPCASLSEVTQEEMSDFLQLIKKLEALVKETFGATMFNWACSMNHAHQVNPPNPQVHWHMIPRYIRPVEFRGKTFRDEHFGYRSVSEMDMVSDDLFEAIVDALQNNISSIKAVK